MTACYCEEMVVVVVDDVKALVEFEVLLMFTGGEAAMPLVVLGNG